MRQNRENWIAIVEDDETIRRSMERYINRRIFLGDPLRKSPPPSTLMKTTVILTAALLCVLSPISGLLGPVTISTMNKTQ